ncbi:CinA family protein [Nocardia harenae]|uniref:CinA family protein n=1 Tax=Nocardia harenae TaxID=358707 RepID=UPI000A03C6F7|nr:CinA family protein [Nocardia harenae]
MSPDPAGEEPEVPESERTAALAERVAAATARTGRTVAVAESLTAGRIAAALGAAPDSGTWLRGGVVAYAAEVKHTVLGVPDVPVVTATAAGTMATGVRGLLGADVAVAVTGVGGPDPQDGEPAGSVWFGVTAGDTAATCHHVFDGDPVEVLEQTVTRALELLRDAVATGDAEPADRVSE